MLSVLLLHSVPYGIKSSVYKIKIKILGVYFTPHSTTIKGDKHVYIKKILLNNSVIDGKIDI